MQAIFPSTCVVCGVDIERGEEVDFHPTLRGPKGGKKVAHIRCLNGSRKNPFYVTPKGTAVHVSDEEYAAHRASGTMSRLARREAEIENVPGLPAGYEIRESKDGYFHILFRGQDTGKYASDPRKAAEIVSRMKDGVVVKGSPRFQQFKR